MFKSLIIAATLVVSAVAQANSPAEVLFSSQKAVMQDVVAMGLPWQVGDENNYKITMGFLPGTMKMFVREINADRTEAWLVQDVNLLIQKQKIEALIDMNTGETKKMLVDGQEQQVPASNYEIIDQKEAQVTVPAGTFRTMYIKIQDNGNNGQITEQWVNGRDIPVNGMAKSMSDSPLGKVTIELTSFKKN
ncbi:MAG: hypothetical protein NDI63_15570 [Pseudobdellovibrio sp.]|nr:hypothetical protein [Pseudobdellovibrio sp.]